MGFIESERTRSVGTPFDLLTRRLQDVHVVVHHPALRGFDVGHDEPDVGERVWDLCAWHVRRRGISVRVDRGIGADEFEQSFGIVLLLVELGAGLVAGAVLAAVGVA